MGMTGKNAKIKGIVKCNSNESVVGQDAGIEKLKCAVLGCLYGCNVAGQAFQCRPQFSAWLAKNPPVVSVSCAIILIAFRFHAATKSLVNGWMLSAQILCA